MYMELFISQWPKEFWLSSKPKRVMSCFFLLFSHSEFFFFFFQVRTTIWRSRSRQRAATSGLDCFVGICLFPTMVYVWRGEREREKDLRLSKKLEDKGGENAWAARRGLQWMHLNHRHWLLEGGWEYFFLSGNAAVLYYKTFILYIWTRLVYISIYIFIYASEHACFSFQAINIPLYEANTKWKGCAWMKGWLYLHKAIQLKLSSIYVHHIRSIITRCMESVYLYCIHSTPSIPLITDCIRLVIGNH